MSVKATASILREQGATPVAGTVAGAEGTAVATTGTGTAVDKKKGNSSFEEFKATGVSARATMTEEEKNAEGGKSNVIQFVTALGNPAKKVKRVQKKDKIDSHECIGYRLKALEAVQVPTCVPKKGAKSSNNPMDVEDPIWREVPAGEDFDVSLAELGHLISQPQYAGSFTGGNDEVVLHVTISESRGSVPLTVLKRKSAPIKDNMILVADKTTVDGKPRYVVKDEFKEKYGYLFERTATTRGTSEAKATGESQKDLAKAFALYIAKKN